MLDPIVKHCFVELNGSFVHLKQYGAAPINLFKQIAQANVSNNNACNHDKARGLIVFVPGNPGSLGVYHDFLSLLTSRLRAGITILAMGHNNFDHPEHVNYPAEGKIFIDEKDMNFVEKTLSREYSLDPHHVELQVLNKLIILRRILNKITGSTTPVSFVGHSIGCYVILRLLQDKQLAKLHAGSILIHPALENLALTEKGQYIDRVFSLKLDYVTKLIAFLLDSLLPNAVKLQLTRRFCSPEFVSNSSDEVIESLMQLVCSRHLDALIRMAKSELANVKQLDCEQMIKPHKEKLRLLYATEDHWVNDSHRRALRRLYQDDIHIEERDTMHAFVMDPKTVVEYANVVADFVNHQFAGG